MSKLTFQYNSVQSGKVGEYVCEFGICGLVLKHHIILNSNNSYYECDPEFIKNYTKPLYGIMTGYHLLQIENYVALIRFTSSAEFNILSAEDIATLFNPLCKKSNTGIEFAYDFLGINLYSKVNNGINMFDVNLDYYNVKRGTVCTLVRYGFNTFTKNPSLLYASRLIDNNSSHLIEVITD